MDRLKGACEGRSVASQSLCCWPLPAQSGLYTKQFRVSPPAPTAPDPFSQGAVTQSQPPLGKPTLQRFSASLFPDSSRNLGIFIRNRIISSPKHPRHAVAQLAKIYAPLLLCPDYVNPIDPYSYDLRETGRAAHREDRIADESSSFRIEASTDPKGRPESKTSAVTFKSAPAGAELYVDGIQIGKTPYSVPLTSGLYTIFIQQWGYEAWQQALTVLAGGKIIDATLQENYRHGIGPSTPAGDAWS